jgi:4-oxalocrotonate tautomerase
MPLVRIDMIRGRREEQIAAISHAVQRALVETMNVPERDQFQMITEHAPGRLAYNRAYLGVERTDGFVFVQVTLSAGRTTEQKKAFYARAAQLMAEGAKMRSADVAISLIESTREDWSFGNGIAQYVELPKEQWK